MLQGFRFSHYAWSVQKPIFGAILFIILGLIAGFSIWLTVDPLAAAVLLPCFAINTLKEFRTWKSSLIGRIARDWPMFHSFLRAVLASGLEVAFCTLILVCLMFVADVHILLALLLAVVGSRVIGFMRIQLVSFWMTLVMLAVIGVDEPAWLTGSAIVLAAFVHLVVLGIVAAGAAIAFVLESV